MHLLTSTSKGVRIEGVHVISNPHNVIDLDIRKSVGFMKSSVILYATFENKSDSRVKVEVTQKEKTVKSQGLVSGFVEEYNSARFEISHLLSEESITALTFLFKIDNAEYIVNVDVEELFER